MKPRMQITELRDSVKGDTFDLIDILSSFDLEPVHDSPDLNNDFGAGVPILYRIYDRTLGMNGGYHMLKLYVHEQGEHYRTFKYEYLRPSLILR